MNVIEVKGLGKKYRIGKAEKKSETLVGSIVNGLKQPLENLRKIRSLTRLNDEEDIVWALRDVSFEVKEGEVLGIIGHNGAGKSTLLKILSRITEPSVGEVQIKGRVAALLEVGTGFHPELTGRENVYMNGTILGMRKKEIDRKLGEIVAFSGVEKFLDTPVKFYSSGMRVRLGFSVAAHLEPEILIIDEVLAVGDAEFQRKCLGKMQDVSTNQGRTVLFVSHNMAAVKKLCTRGVVLENGSVVCTGEVNTVIDYYQNRGITKIETKKQWPVSTFTKEHSIRPISLEIIPRNGSVFSVDNGFDIVIQLINTIPDKNLGCTIKVSNRDQIVVFVAGALLSEKKDSKVGKYTISYFIPGHLLNADVYSLSLKIGEDQRFILYDGEGIVHFEILNTATGRGNNLNVAPGVVRPIIEHDINFEQL